MDPYIFWGLIVFGLLLWTWILAEIIAWVDRRRPRNWVHKRHRANKRWTEMIGGK